MNRPIHFELHSNDPARDSKFYEAVFGWKFNKWDGPMEYWLASTSPDGAHGASKEHYGIDGGMMKSQDGQPRTVNTIEVADVDAMAMKVSKAGGTIVVPRMAIPGVGWLVYFTDPTGNIVGIMQTDANAK